MDCFADFHTHILPNLDDGSVSIEQSLEMLKMEAKSGVKRVVFTPHFYPHESSISEFLQARNHAYNSLLEATKDIPGLPEMYLGAEVYFYRGMAASEDLKHLTIAGSRYILVEMPEGYWSEGMYEELESMYKNGLYPIIAHLDRYITPFNTQGIPEKLARLPVLVQMNTQALDSFWKRKQFLKYLKKDMVHLIGTDCHNCTSRPPKMQEATKWLKPLGEQFFQHIREYEDMILSYSR